MTTITKMILIRKKRKTPSKLLRSFLSLHDEINQAASPRKNCSMRIVSIMRTLPVSRNRLLSRLATNRELSLCRPNSRCNRIRTLRTGVKTTRNNRDCLLSNKTWLGGSMTTNVTTHIRYLISSQSYLTLTSVPQGKTVECLQIRHPLLMYINTLPPRDRHNSKIKSVNMMLMATNLTASWRRSGNKQGRKRAC